LVCLPPKINKCTCTHAHICQIFCEPSQGVLDELPQHAHAHNLLMSQTHSYTPSLHQHPAHPPISHTHTCKFAHTRKNTETHATPKTLWHVHKATNRYASNISLWIAPSTCRSFARTRVVSLLSRTRVLDSLFFSLFFSVSLFRSRVFWLLSLSRACARPLSLSQNCTHIPAGPDKKSPSIFGHSLGQDAAVETCVALNPFSARRCRRRF